VEKNISNQYYFKRILTLCILSTGGTIEKTYDEGAGALKNIDSRLREILMSALRLPYTEIDFESIMAMDSLHMTMEDRELILKTVVEKLKKPNYPIIILHGTDTLTVTAELFFNKIKAPKVPIIFTGAMKPMGFMDSDAPQNVTEAIMAARILPPGIYVSFHGRIFEIPNVRKNKETRTFEDIS